MFKVRFKRNRITDINYLRNVIIYIHLNPVNHNFTTNFQDYLYSSYNSILSSKNTVLKRMDVIDLFEDKENFIQVHLKSIKNGNFEEFE